MSIRVQDQNGLRTIEQAEKDFARFTSREARMRPVFEAAMARLSAPYTVSVVDRAISTASGKLITDEQAKSEKIDFTEADWTLWIGTTELPIEAMVHPERFTTCSIKRTKIYRCLDKNAPIVIIRDGFFDWYPTSTLHLFKTYPMQPLKGMGGALGVLLLDDDVEKLVDEGKIARHFWSPEELKMIDRKMWRE